MTDNYYAEGEAAAVTPPAVGSWWCPACEAPVEECREADEIRRRIANLEGRIDDAARRRLTGRHRR